MRTIFKNIVLSIITWEARMVLKKYEPRIIAVTGSVGKTCTKDAIFDALDGSFYVRKSEKSLNSEFGVPLTILGCENGWYNPFRWIKNMIEGLLLIITPNHYPKWLVLEVGADAPGDIKKIGEWLKPDVAIITALPDVPVHVEFFNSPEDVIREKKELAKALKKDGTLILGGDDKNTMALAQEFSRHQGLTYGIAQHNNVVASHIGITYNDAGAPEGMEFRVDERGSEVPMCLLGRLGQQQIYPILAAFAVGKAVGVGPLTTAKELAESEPTPGRMRILPGYNASTIIDDSYNSSPTALRAALTTLKKVESKGKKIAVLGDMLELGKYSTEAHKKAGIQVAGIADVLVTVGMRAKGIAQSAREAGFDIEHIQEFEVGEGKEAGRYVRAMLEEGDVVLVKGSQTGIRLEKAVKELMAEPSRARELLVRQEDEWLIK